MMSTFGKKSMKEEVHERYQIANDNNDNLAFEDAMFDDIDPSVKLSHSWSKLREIFKSLSKDFEIVRDNHKQSGNHDDFINFCNNRSDVYYLYCGFKRNLMCLMQLLRTCQMKSSLKVILSQIPRLNVRLHQAQMQQNKL